MKNRVYAAPVVKGLKDWAIARTSPAALSPSLLPQLVFNSYIYHFQNSYDVAEKRTFLEKRHRLLAERHIDVN